MAIFSFKKRKARALHKQAQILSDAGNDDEALVLYEKAIALAPEKAESHYNIGLIYKYRNDWEKSYAFNATANELDPDDESALWNLAIAATALRDWATARKAWKDAGISIDNEEGPIEGDFGLTPVRLNPDGNAEVVWAQRIDPARARILNVPLPESGYFAGDIVLHDGAPVGYRMHGEIEKPVFNVLELFERSALKTFKVTVKADGQSDIDELQAILEQRGMIAEDWTTNYRVLCQACSEGRPHDEHDTVDESIWISRHEIGVGASDETSLRGALQAWTDNEGRTIIEVTCVLE
ncbi:tetratricopeptide repeat protein [Thiosocius teredinicola]|uniref:tetratricopeptide repeat protein n=1 Tax=Thiosocius teredinicola TaxID=1973002 RepID=UPI000990D2E8